MGPVPERIVGTKGFAHLRRRMPTARNGDVRLRYRTDGTPAGGTVVFVPDAGCGAWQWAWQAPALAGPVETLVYYPRGTGASDVPAGPYDLDALAGDLAAVLADHGVARATVVGAGLGGLVALHYALGHGRAEQLVLFGTAASGDRFDADPLFAGPTAFAGLLGNEFRSERPEEVDRMAAWRREEDATNGVADAYRTALEAADLSDRLFEVTTPTHVIHGTADAVVPVDAGRSLAEGLPRGQFEAFENGAHWFFIEQSRVVTDRLDGILRNGDR